MSETRREQTRYLAVIQVTVGSSAGRARSVRTRRSQSKPNRRPRACPDRARPCDLVAVVEGSAGSPSQSCGPARPHRPKVERSTRPAWLRPARAWPQRRLSARPRPSCPQQRSRKRAAGDNLGRAASRARAMPGARERHAGKADERATATCRSDAEQIRIRAAGRARGEPDRDIVQWFRQDV